MKAAFPIIPTLLEMLGNPQQDPYVRERVIWALRIHGDKLRTIKDTKETFAKVLKEPLNLENKMLRYDCAYMLGMIWQQQAPDAALDVLAEFLKDSTIQIYADTFRGVGGTGSETISGIATVKERGLGDGRIMAVNALQMIGSSRYGLRADIMKQLRFLAADQGIYQPLRQKALELIKAAQ